MVNAAQAPVMLPEPAIHIAFSIPDGTEVAMLRAPVKNAVMYFTELLTVAYLEDWELVSSVIPNALAMLTSLRSVVKGSRFRVQGKNYFLSSPCTLHLAPVF
jgi:hypothetical protein